MACDAAAGSDPNAAAGSGTIGQRRRRHRPAWRVSLAIIGPRDVSTDAPTGASPRPEARASAGPRRRAARRPDHRSRRIRQRNRKRRNSRRDFHQIHGCHTHRTTVLASLRQPSRPAGTAARSAAMSAAKKTWADDAARGWHVEEAVRVVSGQAAFHLRGMFLAGSHPACMLCMASRRQRGVARTPWRINDQLVSG